VFLLITFFMLVAQIQRTRLVSLELPMLSADETAPSAPDDSAVVNVLPIGPDGQTRGYRVGARTFSETPEGLAELSEALQQLATRDANVRVLVRASRLEAYERVHPLLAAIAQTGVTRVNLVTVEEAVP
jgi:biopolymer transport protein ExbD